MYSSLGDRETPFQKKKKKERERNYGFFSRLSARCILWLGTPGLPTVALGQSQCSCSLPNMEAAEERTLVVVMAKGLLLVSEMQVSNHLIQSAQDVGSVL